MNDVRYLYEVRPVKPIVISGKSVRRPCSIQLTKAEVTEYMKSASIYRRFVNVNMEPIKVTGENLDSLHQASYNPGFKPIEIVSVVVPKIDKVEEIAIVEEPEKEEVSVTPDETVIEEEPIATTETTTETIIEEETPSVQEVVIDETTDTEDPVVVKVEEEKPLKIDLKANNNFYNNQGKNNYHGKNKNNYKK